MDVTKQQAREALGLRSYAELADFFDVSRQAIDQWDRLPEGRYWELRARRPDLFDKLGQMHADREASNG